MHPCSAGQTLRVGRLAGQLAGAWPRVVSSQTCSCFAVTAQWAVSSVRGSRLRKCRSWPCSGSCPSVKGSTSYGQWELLCLACCEVSHNVASFPGTWTAKAGKGSALPSSCQS